MRRSTFIKIAVLIAVVYVTFRLLIEYRLMFIVPAGMGLSALLTLFFFPPKDSAWESFVDKVYFKIFKRHLEQIEVVEIVPPDYVPPVKPEDYYSVDRNRLVINDSIYDYVLNARKLQNIPISAMFMLYEKTPSIEIVENGKVCASYKLDNYDNESFDGKYLYFKGTIFTKERIPVLSGQGVIINSRDDAGMEIFNDFNSIIYRLEYYFIGKDENEAAKNAYEASEGLDLEQKGLKYTNRITPLNVRCVGICRNCGESFVFNTWNYPMAHSEPVYSEDGLNTAKVTHTIVDKLNWKITLNGITYRYYNSFCCPHCGAPYIDYDKHHDMKGYGNLGCVHIGKHDRIIGSLSELVNDNSDALNLGEILNG